MIKAGVDEIEEKLQIITTPFQLRERGVETKLILGNAACGPDETLIQNVAKAHLWFEQIEMGRALSEVVKTEGTTTERIY